MFIVIIVIVLSHQFTVVQHATARLSTTLYVNIKYSDRDFQYQHIEFESHFGDYFVSYKDKNGENISFIVTPKFFPVIVLYDPLNPGP